MFDFKYIIKEEKKMFIKNLFQKLIVEFKPTQIIVLGFLLIILIGALLLVLPISSQNGECISFIDALFTSTSAVCVTGLATVCTATHWTFFGKVVILLLIQIGGLGFVSIMMSILVLLGKKITLKERIIIQESFNLNTISGMVSFIRVIVKTALLIEGIGAVILTLAFLKDYNLPLALANGVFHSVSAFCNAGFDILGEYSVMDYSGNYVIMIVMMILIISGGIGFPVLLDIKNKAIDIIRKECSISVAVKRLTLHSKLAIIITFIMIVSGWIFFLLIEYNNPQTLGNLSFSNKIINAMFQSVTLRTAGFFSIDQGALRDASKFISIIFMAIGGSPGGTAGGLKTVTLGIILISVASVIKGSDSISAFKKSISFHTLQKALSVAIMILLFIFISTIAVSLSESSSGISFIDILFETVSALGTTGLSTGITPIINSFSKSVLIMCMFVGRLGPITIAVALATRKGNNNLLHYPEEKIIVG